MGSLSILGAFLRALGPFLLSLPEISLLVLARFAWACSETSAHLVILLGNLPWTPFSDLYPGPEICLSAVSPESRGFRLLGEERRRPRLGMGTAGGPPELYRPGGDPRPGELQGGV